MIANNNQTSQFTGKKISISQVRNGQGKETDKHAFISKVQRFQFHPRETPGPGTYDGLIRQKHTTDYKIQKDDKTQTAVAKEHQWIMGSQRAGFIMSQSWGNKLGPGQYDQIDPHFDSNRSNWAKGLRFGGVKQPEDIIGPGYYASDESISPKRSNNKPQSVFQSKTSKSFLDQIIQKNKVTIKKLSHNPEDDILQQNQEKEQNNSEVSQEPMKKTINRLSPMFLSKCTRPPIMNPSPQALGPGSYSLQQSNQLKSVKSKGVISGIHYRLNPLRFINRSITLSSKIVPPGPGSYNIQQLGKSQALNKSPLGLIFRQERFKVDASVRLKQFVPGPGQYMQNRYTMINQDQIRIKNKGSFARKAQKQIHDFGSAARSSLRNHNKVPFGQYNVDYFDLHTKLMKQKQHYDKLKLMQVTLPAFNTKTKH